MDKAVNRVMGGPKRGSWVGLVLRWGGMGILIGSHVMLIATGESASVERLWWHVGGLAGFFVGKFL